MELLAGGAGALDLSIDPVVGVLVGVCLLAWLYVGARLSLQHWDKRADRVAPDLRRAADHEAAAPGFPWMQPNDPDDPRH